MKCATCPKCKWSKTLLSHYCAAEGLSATMSIEEMYAETAKDCQKRPNSARQGSNPGIDTGTGKRSEK